jgi:hypothetical protein
MAWHCWWRSPGIMTSSKDRSVPTPNATTYTTGATRQQLFIEHYTSTLAAASFAFSRCVGCPCFSNPLVIFKYRKRLRSHPSCRTRLPDEDNELFILNDNDYNMCVFYIALRTAGLTKSSFGYHKSIPNAPSWKNCFL